jgi:hypothetical protein
MTSAAGGRRGGVRGPLTTEPGKPNPAAGKALVIPFPRQRTLIKQIAARMAAAHTVEAAERLLQKQSACFGRALRARKVSDAAVIRQLRSFEAAVRTELWRVVFGQPAKGRRR